MTDNNFFMNFLMMIKNKRHVTPLLFSTIIKKFITVTSKAILHYTAIHVHSGTRHNVNIPYLLYDY